MGSLSSVVTADDFIATINHSNTKHILVEGTDDLIFFRKLEDEFYSAGISVLPVGGRKTVLEIFDRKNEITDSESVIFFVDQDLWVYSNLPENYQHLSLKTTFGYSIENDLYTDGKLEGLLLSTELDEFRSNLAKFSYWYALALYRILNGDENQSISDHPKSIISRDDRYIEKCTLSDHEVHPADLATAISNEYQKLLRGKSLLELILMQLAVAGRTANYSRVALMEIGVLANGHLMGQIRGWVQDRLCPS